jgi:uracil-DNA glycosylase
MNDNIAADWKKLLEAEFAKPYFQKIGNFLKTEQEHGYEIFPRHDLVLEALRITPFANLKVVLLGQDPYHTPKMATGLSFSIPPTEKLPPSLKNIFKELQTDLNIPQPVNGDIRNWADQGVLLLNTNLTVRKGEAASHSKIGWQIFTNKIIEIINERCNSIVFILWGKHAQEKKDLINTDIHLILEAAHPSPLSAYKGFLGCKHFSKTNQWLQQNNILEIDWQVL